MANGRQAKDAKGNSMAAIITQLDQNWRLWSTTGPPQYRHAWSTPHSHYHLHAQAYTCDMACACIKMHYNMPAAT